MTTQTEQQPSTELVRTSHEGNGALALYARMPDPLVAAESIGRWLNQAGMAKSPGAGAVLALSAICRGADIVEFVSEHQVVMGRVVRDYDLLLADLREQGGDYEWVDTGDDGKQATLKWTWKGRNYQYTFTMDMARQAGLVKADSGWEKWPGNMLRSKCVRHGMKMHSPDLIRGYTTPEDAVDYQPAAPLRTKEDVESRKAELAAMQNAAVEQESIETTAGIVGDGKLSDEQLKRINELAETLGIDDDKMQAGLQKRYNVGARVDLTAEQAAELIGRLESLLEKKLQTSS